MKRQQKYPNSENQSFIIHESTIRMSSLLSDEELGRLIRKFYLYSGQGEVPDEEPNLAVAIIFNEWRLQFEYDKQHYTSACQKRSEAGRKGMANRWQKSDAPADDLCIDNDNDNTLAEEDNQAPTATAEDNSTLIAVVEDNAALLTTTENNAATSDIANDNNAMQSITKITDNDNDIDYDINKKEISPNGETKKKVSLASSPTLENRKSDFYQSIVPFADLYDREMLNDFYQYWTELDKRRRRMRFEMQKTWETGKRLSAWPKAATWALASSYAATVRSPPISSNSPESPLPTTPPQLLLMTTALFERFVEIRRTVPPNP